MAENGEFTSWDVGKKKSDRIADVVIAGEFKKDRRANRMSGSARAIQRPVKGYKMSISEVTDLMIRHMSEKGGARMTDQPNESQTPGVSRSEFDQHKTMIDQRFDHLEKVNTMQYESIQKDMNHGFEIMGGHIGALADKIAASEKEVAGKFDSFENKILLKMNEQKTEILDTVRSERKEDHKYIFNTLVAIMGVGFAALGVLVTVAIAVLTFVLT